MNLEDDGLLHTSCGTRNYVAPEVLNDGGYDGATADIWSCRVVLFVLLAGYLPFEDDNLMILYNKISTSDFTFPSWLSFGAKRLLTKILDPNPMTEFKRETRFTSKCPAKEIIDKIEEAARPLGFDVQKKNYKMRLENVKARRKGNLNVATELTSKSYYILLPRDKPFLNMFLVVLISWFSSSGFSSGSFTSYGRGEES